MFPAILAFARFEIELFFKTFIAVFFTFLAPCGIYASLVSVAPGDKQLTASLYLPVILGLIIIFVSLFTLAAQVVGYREMGFYKRILVTKINPVGIALSNAIRGYVVVLIGLALLMLQARFMFGAFPTFNVVQAAIAIFIAGGGLFLVCLIPACFVKRSRSMFTLATVLSYLLVLFSGAMPPLGEFGQYTRQIDPFSPSYHAVQVLQAGFSGTLLQADMVGSIVFLLGCVGVSLVVIRRFLSWM
jgi:ABC-2 type transport system permease protein